VAADRHAWLRRRNRGFHVTIRDVDCRDFDVERFIDDLVSMHATFFSFFVGGYVTTYPTVLAYQRVSPYLEGRDLAGEIVEAAHGAGLKALGMIDLGQVTAEAAADHPEWCTQDERGRLEERVPGLYASCPMGGYQNDYVREIVAEILGRYPLDCVKFGGGSFGFSRSVCHCPSCRQSFSELTGSALPTREDWDAPLWRTYTGWRLEQSRRRVVALGEVVRSIDPEMPFMGNSVCFGDPHWTVGASIDVEHQAAVADAVQVEIQTRARYDEATGAASWQYMSWPAETARFMTSVSDTPIWVVTSYFLAWPWRRSAMAPVEQKVYLAQVAANGADPMVNLSGGPPAVHEDPRGFEVIRELYGFLAQHWAHYEGDTSGANVAIVYSLPTLFYYGKGDPERRYVREIRGVEQALHAAHIPFDIISTRVLTPELLARYDVLVLPALACMKDDEVAAIRSYVDGGGSIVTTFETSLYDPEGVRRNDFLLSDLVGAHYAGVTQSSMDSADEGYKQVYAGIHHRMDIEHPHPLLAGMDETSLLPMGGEYCLVSAATDAAVPLTLSAPFIVFPEGFSYPTVPASGAPLAVARQLEGGGRSVYFAGALGSLAWTVPYPDLQELIANAVLWAADGRLPLRVTAPATLQVSLRKQTLRPLPSGEGQGEGGSASRPTAAPCGSGSRPDLRFPQSSREGWREGAALVERRMVHLINLTGGERFFRELVPLRDVVVSLSPETGYRVVRAYTLTAGVELPITCLPEAWQVTVPEVTDYEVLVFELGSE
jgi:hypothetical protein